MNRAEQAAEDIWNQIPEPHQMDIDLVEAAHEEFPEESVRDHAQLRISVKFLGQRIEQLLWALYGETE